MPRNQSANLLGPALTQSIKMAQVWDILSVWLKQRTPIKFADDRESAPQKRLISPQALIEIAQVNRFIQAIQPKYLS